MLDLVRYVVPVAALFAGLYLAATWILDWFDDREREAEQDGRALAWRRLREDR